MKRKDSYLLKARDISKHYGGVQALKQVQLEVGYGEVHALVGENGAGKSTLIKILGGIVPRDSGTIIFDGREVVFHTPSESQASGIAIIHQELSMMPDLSVMENLFMNNMSHRLGFINWAHMRERTRAALDLVGLDVSPDAIVGRLSISQRQMIEIARALSTNARLIIMDEPNSSLSDAETERLFELIRGLTARDISIIYVSHKIDEVLSISDRITVFRDGKYIRTLARSEANEDTIISLMVGRELDRRLAEDAQVSEETLLEVQNLSGHGFHNVSFSVKKGEILAFSGLVGAGRSEVMRTIFGADKPTSGKIMWKGQEVRFRSPADAIRQGIAMVQEDRKALSLFMGMPIYQNMSMAELPLINRNGIIHEAREQRRVNSFVERLDIRLASIFAPVSSLSGGNQQKTVLARWLAIGPELLILDEPTHGVDIGAKSEIYNLVRELAKQGVSVILVSSELPEVLALAHRIVVMCEGRVTGILPRAEANEEILMTYATGVRDDFAVRVETEL